jgi:hypothetical protein
MAQAQLSPPQLEFVFAAEVKVDAPLDLGDVGKGGRRSLPRFPPAAQPDHRGCSDQRLRSSQAFSAAALLWVSSREP